ncbi:MAG TPA: cytidylate kinase-like family protein [Bryobacteraceae bacterium]|nr:cytidylate kinase-like family protein [Bryobacteraceae bacterium]
MAIRVITVEREYGAGGGAVAGKLASRLGWKLWDHALTEEIARRLDCDCRVVEEHEERSDAAYYRLFKAFMRGSFEGSLNAPRLKMVDTECVRVVVRKLLPELAGTGNCVIVGRGSAFYLGDRPDAFHVFVYAPFADRVRRLRATGESEKDAMELAETVDRDRAAFTKRYFDADWAGRHHYHLMVNSGMGDDVAVDIILDAIARFQKERAG